MEQSTKTEKDSISISNNEKSTTIEKDQSLTVVKPSIRHAEKRRTSTCRFADRVAKISVDHYKMTIPAEERPSQTCVATIVIYDSNDRSLRVMSMGVGTKFLSESVMQQQQQNNSTSKGNYGRCVRDMHAEILACRAFRRQLLLEMLHDLKGDHYRQNNDTSNIKDQPNKKSILRRSSTTTENTEKIQYKLRPGITIHLYTSSAPCGNATLKKFCKMSKEQFQDELGPDEWPTTPHQPPPGHSVKLGEFALLLKKDNSSKIEELQPTKKPRNNNTTSTDHQPQDEKNRKGKPWPADVSDEWAPPGTTIVGFWHKGSIHTCSDKICRWNYLGIQGSFLASMLEEPLYLSTVTVGRKLSGAICRRAICCRLDHSRCPQINHSAVGSHVYRTNHPAVMGTAVYLDETGVVETSNESKGQDVRFHSTVSWVWWPGMIAHGNDGSSGGVFERINAATGYLTTDSNNDIGLPAQVSTYELTNLFFQVYCLATANDFSSYQTEQSSHHEWQSLQNLLNLKRKCSPLHEQIKDELFSNHQVFSHWRRRFSPFS
jgi:double-stranded RNA-specific adenosine deaminase